VVIIFRIFVLFLITQKFEKVELVAYKPTLTTLLLGLLCKCEGDTNTGQDAV